MRVLIEGVLGRFSIMLALGFVPLVAIAQGANQSFLAIESSLLPLHVDTAPDVMLDRGPFTGIWLGNYREAVARAEVPVYRELPARPGTPDAELDQVGVIEVGTWIETTEGSGAALVGIHYGYIDSSSLYWSGTTLEIDGERLIPLYTNLGEGLFRGFYSGQIIDVMPTRLTDNVPRLPATPLHPQSH